MLTVVQVDGLNEQLLYLSYLILEWFITFAIIGL